MSGQVEALAAHYPTGCYAQPEGDYAIFCRCGAMARGEHRGKAMKAWAVHASAASEAKRPENALITALRDARSMLVHMAEVSNYLSLPGADVRLEFNDHIDRIDAALSLAKGGEK